MAHGAGGKASRRLVEGLFAPLLFGSSAEPLTDSARVLVDRTSVAVTTDSFVVMPNHVHFILVLEGSHRYSPNINARHINVRLEPAVRRRPGLEPPRAGSLSAIVRSYKAGVPRRCHDSGMLNFAWQPGFYEHILRGNSSVEKVRDYIMNNPPRWSTDPENITNHSRKDDQWWET